MKTENPKICFDRAMSYLVKSTLWGNVRFFFFFFYRTDQFDHSLLTNTVLGIFSNKNQTFSDCNIYIKNNKIR